MYRHTKKIPTIIALILLIIGIGGGIYLVENRTTALPKASVSSEPQSVQITNITQNSFSVTWLTKEEATGSVIYGTSQKNIDQIAFDDRDFDNKAKAYFTHHITIRNLNPQTSYFFTVISADKKFQNNNKPYTITTAAKSESASLLEPTYGQVLTSQNQPAEGALVIINLPRGLPLSTLVKPSGNFLVPLNIARDISLNPYAIQDQSSIPISISVYASLEEKAQASTDSKNDSPVPPITIGKTYNFEGLQGKKKDGVQLAEIQPTVLPSQKPILGAITSKQVEILSPEEGATFVSTKPLFRGKGIAGKEVTIEIDLNPKISGKTIVSANGLWSWTPSRDIPPNSHKVKITTVDENGKQVMFERNFIVFKSGTQVLGEATPSGTITTTPTRTPTPTLAIGQASPSATIKPTSTIIPTITKIPVSGNISTTLYFLVGGFILVFIGFAKLRHSV